MYGAGNTEAASADSAVAPNSRLVCFLVIVVLLERAMINIPAGAAIAKAQLRDAKSPPQFRNTEIAAPGLKF
jgi:hypothetical protein